MELVLACSVKLMNDNLGPEGLVPVAPIFGEFHELSVTPGHRTVRLTLFDSIKIA